MPFGLYLNIFKIEEILQFWGKKFSTCVARFSCARGLIQQYQVNQYHFCKVNVITLVSYEIICQNYLYFKFLLNYIYTYNFIKLYIYIYIIIVIKLYNKLYFHLNHLKETFTTEEEDYFVNNIFMRCLIIFCDRVTDFWKSRVQANVSRILKYFVLKVFLLYFKKSANISFTRWLSKKLTEVHRSDVALFEDKKMNGRQSQGGENVRQSAFSSD